MARVNFVSVFLQDIKFITITLLSYLCLRRNIDPILEEFEEEEEENCPNYLLLLEAPSPAFVSVPKDLLKAHIKRKLPVLKLGQLRLFPDDHNERGTTRLCTICLDCLNEQDSVRELMNCDHVFHKDCLDCWVDQGKVTCPLCRSMLFSTRGTQVLREIRG